MLLSISSGDRSPFWKAEKLTGVHKSRQQALRHSSLAAPVTELAVATAAGCHCCWLCLLLLPQLLPLLLLAKPAHLMFLRSMSNRSLSPGRCTFTTTRSPDFSRARWTCKEHRHRMKGERFAMGKHGTAPRTLCLMFRSP